MRAAYFAFGSNMSRRRLEARIGEVWVSGRAYASGYVHRFDKLGLDGTAKGNIVPCEGETVVGVLYRITPEQLASLERFEGGYHRVRVSVVAADDVSVEAATFIARQPGCDVDPSVAYLRHYAHGLAEHGVELAYCRRLVAGVAPGLAAQFLREVERLRSR